MAAVRLDPPSPITNGLGSSPRPQTSWRHELTSGATSGTGTGPTARRGRSRGAKGDGPAVWGGSRGRRSYSVRVLDSTARARLTVLRHRLVTANAAVPAFRSPNAPPLPKLRRRRNCGHTTTMRSTSRSCKSVAKESRPRRRRGYESTTSRQTVPAALRPSPDGHGDRGFRRDGQAALRHQRSGCR